MVKRTELDKYLSELLETRDFKDYCPNGLQVEGKDEIKKVAFSVSATIDSITQAQNFGADALIVHHGLFWSYQSGKTITGPFHKRIAPLIKNEMNLFAYHLPLDAHLELGNAAGIANKLGLTKLKPFGDHKGSPTGVQGTFKKAITPAELEAQLTTLLNHKITYAGPTNSKIQSLGIITGGANNDWPMALQAGLDAYLTGEISEYNWHDAQEAGIHYFAGGHHATERFGVQNLMEHLQTKFKIKCLFIDSANPA
ncbi:MAG: Nif3-like dinuclear metal center hexameric protein [Bacteriovoracaceae bacterium]|nr:Nif3-like dinuclear metal center hexameric protein [Bacteriovoracaceae bacterium]